MNFNNHADRFRTDYARQFAVVRPNPFLDRLAVIAPSNMSVENNSADNKVQQPQPQQYSFYDQSHQNQDQNQRQRRSQDRVTVRSDNNEIQVDASELDLLMMELGSWPASERASLHRQLETSLGISDGVRPRPLTSLLLQMDSKTRKAYLDLARRFYRTIRYQLHSSGSDVKVEDGSQAKPCSLCLVNEAVIANIPCGHIYACIECCKQESPKTCAICRGVCISAVRIRPAQ